MKKVHVDFQTNALFNAIHVAVVVLFSFSSTRKRHFQVIHVDIWQSEFFAVSLPLFLHLLHYDLQRMPVTRICFMASFDHYNKFMKFNC